MNTRREFLKIGAATLPVLAFGLPVLADVPLKGARMWTDAEVIDLINKSLKVFCLESGGDTSYIIAESPERVKQWWFNELAGEPIPDDAEVEEVSPDTIISQGIEDLEDISIEDQENYLYYRIRHINDNDFYVPEVPTHKWNHWLFNQVGISPHEFAWTVASNPELRINFCIKKSAELFLKDTIKNQYPIPCCFCSTAG